MIEVARYIGGREVSCILFWAIPHCTGGVRGAREILVTFSILFITFFVAFEFYVPLVHKLRSKARD